MRRLLLLGVLLVLSGCRNVMGPLQPRSPERVDDPLLTIGEQERKSRSRLSLPDESTNLAPHSGAALPGQFGR